MTPFDEYFYPIFGTGAFIAFLASLAAGLTRGIIFPGFCLVVGVCSFWVALFIGSEVGYREWQAMSNPPAAAFADTMPMGALIGGWLPGSMFCGTVFGIARLARVLFFPTSNGSGRRDVRARESTHASDLETSPTQVSSASEEELKQPYQPIRGDGG